MKGGWPKAKLGEVLHQIDRSETINASRVYRLLGVRWYGQGLFVREEKVGANIAATHVCSVKPGDFVYNRLFAWKGSFAVAGLETNGAHVSNEFPCFTVDAMRLDAHFLLWFFRQTQVWNEVLGLSTGATPTSRNRLKESLFLRMEIPLLPLAQQQRVVARIEELATEIREAGTLRQQARQEAEEIMAVEERRVWPRENLIDAPPLGSLTVFLSRGRQSEQGDSDHFLIKTQHVQQGQYVPTPLRLAPYVAAKVNPEATTRAGDILIACSAAGCLGRVARYRDDGRIASTDTHVAIARANSDVIEPDYLYAYLRGSQGQYQLRSRERGDWQREKVGFRLTELNLNDLKAVPVPLPDKSEQRRIVAELDALQREVDAVTRLQAESAAELDSLLPAILDCAFKGSVG
jgi:type I restriction enzyme S subunit